MDRQYSSRPPSATSMDIPRDDPRPYADRFTLPPLEYPPDRPPPPNSIKYPPSSPIVTLPSLHDQHNQHNQQNQHNQHPYHAYTPQERQPPMRPQEQAIKFSPLQPGSGMPYEFGRQPPETRQVRKIGQRRDTAEEYRKQINGSNSNHTGGGPTSRQPPPPPLQHQQSRPLSRQSSPPPFGPSRPPHDPYRVQGSANSHIINQGDPNNRNVQLLRSPSPQSRDLRKRPSTGALPKPKEQKLRDSSGIGIADLIRPDSSKPQPTYTLHMRQQPLAARACGFGERDRRVVDPPPILELRITPPPPPPPSSNPVPAAMTTSDEIARRLRYPYYVVHCSLWDASRDIDSGAMEGDGSAGGGERRNQQRRLMGTLVASPFVGKDERGVEGCFFCFPDLSCRTTGQYRLRFVLMVLDPNSMRVGERVPFSANVTSGVVTVFAAKDFPGMQASTPLTRRLKEQGCLISVKKGIEKIGERGGESEDEGTGAGSRR